MSAASDPLPPRAQLRDEVLRVLRSIVADPAEDIARVEAAQVLLEQTPARRGVDELLDVVAELGPDERRVLLALGRRLLQGQRSYGLLRTATDGRNWLEERSEELQDVLIYSAIAEVAATTKKPGT